MTPQEIERFCRVLEDCKKAIEECQAECAKYTTPIDFSDVYGTENDDIEVKKEIEERNN